MLIHLPVHVRPLRRLTDRELSLRQQMWTGGREPKSEESVQNLASKYMRTFYPGRQFRVSPFGLNLSKAASGKLKSHNLRAGWHDMEIYEPVEGKFGLCLELKKSGVRMKDKKGNWASQHLADQWHNVQQMRRCGRAAGFVVGLADTVRAIDLYFYGNHLELSDLLSKFED